MLRRAGAVTTMNVDMRERLVALGAPPERTTVLPMGADLDSVRAATAGVTPAPGALLFVGRLVEKKGAAVLLEALRRLPVDLEWSLDVIGDGPLQHRLEELASGLPVRFLGRRGRDELSAALARASVVVVPSVPTASGDQDGLPVALLEAMGSGTAVVASRLPGIDEAVEDGVSGLLVPPGDPEALAAALRRVLADADLRERLGRGASDAAEQHSVSAVGRRYVDLLRSVAAGRSA